MSSWALAYDGYDPETEGVREALCTLGNGYLATRGAAPESTADSVHYPGCYVAGLYNQLTDHIDGRPIENESLVNLPNWLMQTFAVDDGAWFQLSADSVLTYRQELDVRHGVLHRRMVVRDSADRRTAVTERRIVHMDSPHLAAMQTTFEPLNWSGLLRVRSGIDAAVENTGVERYRHLAGRHLAPARLGAWDDETLLVETETVQSRVEITLAARIRFRSNGDKTSGVRVESGESVALEASLPVTQGGSVSVEKVVAVHTNHDRAISEPTSAVLRAIALAADFDELLGTHARAWNRLWDRFDVSLSPTADGNGFSLATLRLHVFHLMQTLSPNSIDLDVGVPARGLHGEAYRGHVFWDELFVLPLLSLHMPSLTRSLLHYRYRRLPAAREAARRAGLPGAMFPWQSGSDGREETQQVHLNPQSGHWLPDVSHLQRHVGLGIGYAVWHYVEASDDLRFLADIGAELLVEISRFFAALATWDERRGRYVITGVMGPDEFHTGYPGAEDRGIDNNAYTNVMVVWLLQRTLELLGRLPSWRKDEVRSRTHLTDAETEHWRTITADMYVPFHDGVISQFDGYEHLKPLDLDDYRRRYGNVQRLDRILEAEGTSVNHYQVSKQADVLMLFYLMSADELVDILSGLGYQFSGTAIRRTIDYYLARTSHGSTLSSVVHSWVLARWQRGRSLEFLRLALSSDVSDVQGGTTAEGIHLAAMAGSVDLLQRCYTGLELRGGVLVFDPSLPPELGELDFTIRYREAPIAIHVTGSTVTLRSGADDGPPIRASCGGRMVVLEPGVPLELSAVSA